MSTRSTTDQPESHHRNVQGGAARAAVFGVSDGLVTNVSLIIGVAGAQSAGPYVRLAGFAGLLAGAFSMAAGEYVSMHAQSELLQHELDMERRELKRSPVAEQRELADIYESRGVAPDIAGEMASEMMRTPEMALETHAREELGVDPSSLGSPYLAAVSSFASFALGAVIPLLPWFFTTSTLAEALSVALAAGSAIVIGTLLARATGRSMWRSALRQLVVSMLAAGFAFAIGRLVGVNVGG
ncbi:MAG TPA: VIT1/CCC1 transporter family protein [Acidimicrobiales bacterium]|jgi:VIT1/CCC1 family predicted Fe2+/Mn2+ transporter|nr:VIT1/CCC1 transporter family protein [Acidimicrobiales bacterium]